MTVDCHHTDAALQQKLEQIYSLHSKKMDFRLDKGPYVDLLHKLGNPHLCLPPTIHIAGTNGKGSTLAFLKSLAESDGLSVHAYTSPHLRVFNERITLNGNPVSDDKLHEYLDLIFEVNDGAPLTFFELTTALMFKAMADHPADLCLLEVGLGGRLDATNIIQSPAATVITSIGYDHMDWLGHEITQIAGEKAGIMKPNAPCFIAPQAYPETYPVFAAKAKDLKTDCHCVNTLQNLPPLGLVGAHQVQNASTALTVWHALRYQKTGLSLNDFIAQDKIKKALAATRWPGRMEKLSDHPEIWFDCGHNQDGALAIAAQVKTWTAEHPDRPVHLILGLAKDKNPQDFLQPFDGMIASVTCVDLPNARNPQSAEDLQKALKAQSPSCPVYRCKSIEQGIDYVQTLSSDPIILITGSIYLYELLPDMTPPYIPK